MSENKTVTVITGLRKLQPLLIFLSPRFFALLFAPLLPCALFKCFYFTDNNTDLDVNLNERTIGEQHSDM